MKEGYLFYYACWRLCQLIGDTEGMIRYRAKFEPWGTSVMPDEAITQF
jgi:hypothetical protein